MLTGLIFSVFTIHPKRTNWMVSEWSSKNQNSSYWGKFCEFLIKGKEIYFESLENSNIRIRPNGRVKMNEKWDEIQGKLDLVRVSGECELSDFDL